MFIEKIVSWRVPHLTNDWSNCIKIELTPPKPIWWTYIIVHLFNFYFLISEHYPHHESASSNLPCWRVLFLMSDLLKKQTVPTILRPMLIVLFLLLTEWTWFEVRLPWFYNTCFLSNTSSFYWLDLWLNVFSMHEYSHK